MTVEAFDCLLTGFFTVLDYAYLLRSGFDGGFMSALGTASLRL